MRVLEIEDFPDRGQYETIAGFMIHQLKRLPHKTDTCKHGGYKFEVLDMEGVRVEQLLWSPGWNNLIKNPTLVAGFFQNLQINLSARSDRHPPGTPARLRNSLPESRGRVPYRSFLPVEPDDQSGCWPSGLRQNSGH